MNRVATAVLALTAALAVSSLVGAQQPTAPAPTAKASDAGEGTAIATFAGGCFWCVESDFDKVDGVVSTVSGFMGGIVPNPTYKLVSSGRTGHKEAVQIAYDPKKVTYSQLLDYYWRHVDLLDGKGQFCDRGDEYRPVIFAGTEEERRLAEQSKAALDKSGRFNKPIAVEIAPASVFTAAEDYHQDYYKKNALQYRYYRYACGRDARIAELWGDEAAPSH